MYVLETHHTYTNPHGLMRRETKFEEYPALCEAQKAMMIYKLSEGIGYTLYRGSINTVQDSKEKNQNIEAQWFDKAAFRGILQ